MQLTILCTFIYRYICLSVDLLMHKQKKIDRETFTRPTHE